MIGKIVPHTIQGELETNILIYEKIEPCFDPKPKITRKSNFNFKQVDPENISLLDISRKDHSFILPSFKFVRFHQVRAVNFSATLFDNHDMEILTKFLLTNPVLYSITLDNNIIIDECITSLAHALKKNTVLCHVSFKGCNFLEQRAIEPLLETLEEINMVLY